jgi:hypothetical protein
VGMVISFILVVPLRRELCREPPAYLPGAALIGIRILGCFPESKPSLSSKIGGRLSNRLIATQHRLQFLN